MRLLSLRTITALCLFVPSLAMAADSGALDQIKGLLKTEVELRAKIDKNLIDSLKALASVSAVSSEDPAVEINLQRQESKVEDARSYLLENQLRIEFFNALIDILDKHGVADLKTDSVNILIDLAHKQLLASAESGTESKLWLFEIYLSIAVRDIMEPSERFADFLKGFMAYSSVRDPRTPQDFLKSRKYIGGDSRTAPKGEQKYLDQKLEN